MADIAGKFLRLAFGALLAASTLGAGGASADVVYTIDQTIGGGSVTGTITTDGVTGTLALSDIVSWDLTLNGVGASAALDPGNSLARQESAASDLGLSVSGRYLYFNFDDTSAGFLIQVPPGGDGRTYWCNSSITAGCYEGKSVVPVYYLDSSSQYVSASGDQIIGVSAPEPSTWAMMLVGFAGLGFAGCRRARRAAAAA